MSQIKLLLVDDEKGFLDTVSKRLKKREVAVSVAYNGEDALTTLENDKTIEAVVLDVKMPGMDGIQTLMEIKKRFPLVEVIMLTGHATVETAINGMKLGAFDYLMKPCDIDVLIALAGEAADKRRQHEEKIIQARIKEITDRRA